MLKRLSHAATLFGLVLAGGPAFAINSDPCGDIACEGDDCLACWEESSDDVVCEEVDKFEAELTCEIDLFQQSLQLVVPQAPRGPFLQQAPGRGQTLPPPAVLQPQRQPATLR